jgi:serine/threonine protein kinase
MQERVVDFRNNRVTILFDIGEIDNIYYDPQLIGSGNQGNIYRVMSNGCKYAMKVTNVVYDCNKNEIKNLIMLHKSYFEHDIPKLYKIYQMINKFYIIMEYIDGTTLTNLHCSIYIEEEIMRISTNILNIIYKIHCLGYIVNDIKNENIMIGENNKIYMIDFSLLCKFDDIDDNIINGTPFYIPPEYEEGKTKKDVWAFGITLYKLLINDDILEESIYYNLDDELIIDEDILKLSLHKMNESFDNFILKKNKNKKMKKIKKIIFACLTIDYKTRPSISKLLNMF